MVCSLHSDNGICRCIFTFHLNGPDASSGGEFTYLYHKNAFSLMAFSPFNGLGQLLFSVNAFNHFCVYYSIFFPLWQTNSVKNA
jgi:hypothetical protein